MVSNKNVKIGCIGLGNMGSAIIAGLAKEFSKENLFGFDNDQEKIKSLSNYLTGCNSIDELVQNSDLIILAVKPNIMQELSKNIKSLIGKSIILSIAAGITIDSFESILGKDKKIIRAMPNTPALVSEGMTVLSPNNNLDQSDINLAEEIFSLLGKTLVMPENYLDAVTAVSGCGPAYGFTIIQAMADAGVKLGIDRNKATLLAAQTLKGAAEMVIQSEECPISLRGKVTSPGGSTIAAVHVLERSAFSGIVMDAVEEAKIVSTKLGEKK